METWTKTPGNYGAEESLQRVTHFSLREILLQHTSRSVSQVIARAHVAFIRDAVYIPKGPYLEKPDAAQNPDRPTKPSPERVMNQYIQPKILSKSELL
ncbi:unnamed protein product [Arctia plantaginis]|uniref:Uncharacterized protein n=1 Tax=Arctia plantaginis TaxID=874455 RepID=A0A8S0YLG1_ARCPL|nr:unnamed protein product [Arctia plantaginis]